MITRQTIKSLEQKLDKATEAKRGRGCEIIDVYINGYPLNSKGCIDVSKESAQRYGITPCRLEKIKNENT